MRRKCRCSILGCIRRQRAERGGQITEGGGVPPFLRALISDTWCPEAALAQPVEQRIRNAWVGCSSHPGGTSIFTLLPSPVSRLYLGRPGASISSARRAGL